MGPCPGVGWAPAFAASFVRPVRMPGPGQGESAAGGSKGAVSLSGLQLKVPLYIQKGDKVVIDTASREFIKRV